MDNMTVTVDGTEITFDPVEWGIKTFDTPPYVMVCDMETGELITVSEYATKYGGK